MDKAEPECPAGLEPVAQANEQRGVCGRVRCSSLALNVCRPSAVYRAAAGCSKNIRGAACFEPRSRAYTCSYLSTIFSTVNRSSK
jgi:hypothetical protein